VAGGIGPPYEALQVPDCRRMTTYFMADQSEVHLVKSHLGEGDISHLDPREECG
jgi:hypothetical protein